MEAAAAEDADSTTKGDAEPAIVPETLPEDATAQEPAPEEPAPEEPVAKEPVAKEPAPKETDGERTVMLLLGLPDGSQKQVRVSRRPMGLEYKVPPHQPAFGIVSVEGHAVELGIETGWTVLGIGEVEMKEASDVSAAAKLLASLPVQMWLEKPDGDEKTVLISRRPLGMEFQRKTPFAVSAVTPGGLAEELGISVGMAVKRVGGIAVGKDGVDAALAEIAGLPFA